jgi:hypothetical protein
MVRFLNQLSFNSEQNHRACVSSERISRIFILTYQNFCMSSSSLQLEMNLSVLPRTYLPEERIPANFVCGVGRFHYRAT